MNFRGSKIFDEYNEEELNQNNQGKGGEQRISLAKYMDKEENFDDMSRKNSNMIRPEDDSFIDINHNNSNVNMGSYRNPNMNAGPVNINDKIMTIKMMISNYLKEKELDM